MIAGHNTHVTADRGPNVANTRNCGFCRPRAAHRQGAAWPSGQSDGSTEYLLSQPLATGCPTSPADLPSEPGHRGSIAPPRLASRKRGTHGCSTVKHSNFDKSTRTSCTNVRCTRARPRNRRARPHGAGLAKVSCAKELLQHRDEFGCPRPPQPGRPPSGTPQKLTLTVRNAPPDVSVACAGARLRVRPKAHCQAWPDQTLLRKVCHWAVRRSLSRLSGDRPRRSS